MDEKINYRAIGAMTAICLVLLGYLIWMVPLSKRSDPVGAFITGQTSIRQIVKILIKTSDGMYIQYIKTSGQWQIQSPYRATANEPMIRELLEAVKKTRIMDVVVKHTEDLSSYGLEEDQRTEVALEFKDGKRLGFRIGARLPLNKIYVYFQKEGNSTVFRAWEGIRLALERHAAVLDQGQPLQFDPSAIVSLELVHKGRSLHMEKHGENWFITRPVKRAANTKVVRSYLESILSLKSSGVYPAGAISQKKLKSPGHLKITLTQGDGDGTVTVQLAPEDTLAPALLFIEQDGQLNIYSTTPQAINKLSFDPDEFYLSNALLFDTGTITNIEVLHPLYSFKLNWNPKGSWQFYHPSTGQRADSDIVGQLLHFLKNLPIGQYLEEDKGRTNSVKPKILVKLSGSTDAATLKIIEDPNGYYRGTSSSHPYWYRLNPNTVKRLEEFYPDALVDRYLLAFDPLRVKQVTVRRGKNYYVLTNKNSSWAWEKPQNRKARSAMAWKLIFGIRDLQYQKRVTGKTEAETDENSCGFQAPDIVIEVQLSSAEPDGKMQLKVTNSEKGLIVSTSRYPGCYLVEGESLDRVLPDFAALTDEL